MRITEFDLYKNLLKEKSGLVITSDKSYLLDSRLSPVAKKWGYPSLEAMTTALQGVPDKDMVEDIVEAMTTNETSFFRDSKPFDLFRDFVLPFTQEKCAAQKNIRIWCAAASTGQEPYSLALILKELAETKMAGWNSNILATDLSNEVLEQAREGIYSQFEVQRGLPIQMLMNNFTQIEEKWQINEDIRNMVKYDTFNLLDNMTSLGTFDIIFCRNVLIYFDEETKAQILQRMAAQLDKNGILFLGGAETVLGITDAFKPVPEKRGIYVQPDHELLNSAGDSGSTTQALA